MLIDAAFIILLVLACIKGIRRGLIVAVFSIIGFIAGLAAALKLSAVVAGRLSEHLDPSYKWLPVLSFLIVFLAVAFLINLGGKLIQKSVETVMLGWVNRLGGMILYVALYSIIFSIFLFYAVQMQLIKPAATEASWFYQYIQPLAPMIINRLGDIIPFFKDMFGELQRFFGGLSNKIGH